MTHKKAVRYFKPRKKTPVKTTFRLMRVGAWRSNGFSSWRSYAANWPLRMLLNTAAQDSEFNSRPYVKKWVAHKLSMVTRRGAAPKLKMRCLFVGRARATNQEMFMTRHTFRQFLKRGMLPGFTKYNKL